MKSLFYSLVLCTSATFAGIVTDTSMQAPENSGIYEQRMGFGPFVEISRFNSSQLNKEMKVEGRSYNLSAEVSNIYGLLGHLPLNDWFSTFAVAGYQKVKIKYADKDLEEAYKNLQEEEENGFPAIDSSDIKGTLNSYNFIVEIGIEAGIPLIQSYKYQFLLKILGFGGGLAGRGFFDETQFLNPMIWGYVYGIGTRIAWERFSLFGGIRSTHFYWHTYYEKKTGELKENDSFMMDFNTMSSPFISLGIDF